MTKTYLKATKKKLKRKSLNLLGMNNHPLGLLTFVCANVCPELNKIIYSKLNLSIIFFDKYRVRTVKIISFSRLLHIN